MSVVANKHDFPGVAERGESGKIRVFPRHPDWQGDSRKFDELYELVREIRIPCFGPTPPPDPILAATPGRCAFCAKTDPEVTFKKEAHTVPAGFGNRHVLSLEECDVCNETFGEELDQQLVNYLAIDRVIAGVRKRGTSSIKLKAPDDTYIEYDHQKQRLVIATDTKRTAAMTRMSGRTETTFEITVYGAAYSFDHVVRELVRLTWMCLRAADREASPEYLDVVRGTRTPAVWQIFRTFVPAAARQVSLRVWRARDGGENIPSTITSFIVGHAELVWASCDGEALVCRPGPLPAFEFDPDYGNAVLRMIVEPLRTMHPAKLETMTFGHTGLVDGEYIDPPAVPRQKQSRPARDLVLRWAENGVERRIATSLNVHRNDGRVMRFQIGGGEFGASLVVHQEPGRSHCEIDIDLTHQPVNRALTTVEALSVMSATAPGAMAYIDDEALFQLANIEGHGLDLDVLQRKLTALSDLAADLGVELTVPAGDDLESWETLDTLTIARHEGVVSLDPFAVRVPGESALDIQRTLAEASGNVAFSWKNTWRIDGTALPVGATQLVISTPCSATFAPIDSTHDAHLRFSDRPYACVFERWSRVHE